MKYEIEIDEFLRNIIYESWMDDEDYNTILNETLNQLGISKKIISDDIETGVMNGYSNKFDLVFIVNIFKS